MTVGISNKILIYKDIIQPHVLLLWQEISKKKKVQIVFFEASYIFKKIKRRLFNNEMKNENTSLKKFKQ